MYIQTVYNTLRNGAKKAGTLLYESYRENGKQKRRTIPYLSQLPAGVIGSLRQFLDTQKSGEKTLAEYANITQDK